MHSLADLFDSSLNQLPTSYNNVTTTRSNRHLKEHGVDIRKKRIHSLALVEHVAKTKHHIFLEDTIILAKEDHYFKKKFKEALEIIKLPHNLNRDGGLEVSTSWLPSILNRKDNTFPPQRLGLHGLNLHALRPSSFK